MTDYLIMIAERELASPSAAAARIAAHARHAASLGATLLDAGHLHADARRVRATHVDTGTFDAVLDRYYLIRANDLDAATAVALELPVGPADAIEVRPLRKGNVAPDKLDRPGKLFAFSVLASAPDEPTWNQLMDRIDDDTKDKFPADRFLGGMRLQAPSAGKRIDPAKRRVLDGPFLESKEVIGGLFFMAMATLDDALHWAATTGFVTHGALEIRELWRT
jgi:hypothetical protein